MSLQAQVLNHFIRLRDELNLTDPFISHDLGVLRHLSVGVVIMYLGREVDVRKTEFFAVKGEIPLPLPPPPGCHFHPCCPHAMPRSSVDKPILKEVAPVHLASCHLNDQL